MEHRRASHVTVTIPAGCSDAVVSMSDSRAEPLVSADVGQVALSSLVAGFDWPGPDPRTHLVLATVDGAGRLLLGEREHTSWPARSPCARAHAPLPVG